MDKNTEAALLALKQNYILNLPSKLNELKALWEQYKSNKEPKVIEETYRNAHSLAGSGATFGQAELGKKAKTLESFIKEKIESNEILSMESISAVDQSIEELFSIVELQSDGSARPEAVDESKKAFIAETTVVENKHIRSMKILVVDDDIDTRKQLVIVLESAGHRVLQAGDGATALDVFQKYEPELVLMDVVLPDIEGTEATVQIKAEAGNRFVPVIFVTSINDMQKIAGFIQSGGDDFLIKPVEPLVLSAKIQAFSRICDMYQKLDKYQRQTEEELETSKYLLDNLLNLDLKNIENVNCWAASPGHFSGDLRLIKQLENGEILILLCDFTGHGLPAAIGTIFVADLFRSMTKKSFDAPIILDEINEKMHQILPTGRYCAAVMISYKPETNSIRIWNCGLPSVLLLCRQNAISQKVESGHVPLGVLGGALNYAPQKFSASEFKSIILFSDGVTEAETADGQMYGEEKLVKKIESVPATDSVFNEVQTDVERFMNGAPPTDDISFIVLSL